MKTYKYTSAQGHTKTITGSNKYQEIRYNAAGEPFVRFKNLSIKLDEFKRYQDEDQSRLIGCEICGACTDTVYSAYLIHISDSNDRAKVFYSYC